MRRVLLAQLPIPPFGIEPIRGNVPLAAAYLKMHALAHDLDRDYEIEILDPRLANLAGEQALVRQILARDPWLVGFSCYLWNIQRTLHIARLLKIARPELLIMLGGPEITLDNDWVLTDPAVDLAAIGEGEQTFVELLTRNARQSATSPAKNGNPANTTTPINDAWLDIPGLYVAAPVDSRKFADLDPHQPNWRRSPGKLPLPRRPLPKLDPISSPYLTGILDVADERMLLLETIRGCIYNCKFCFYPKSYDDLYFVSQEKILANLRHARERGATEVVILDPTLNQRARFDDFVRLLAEANPAGQFSYFGEIRAEGIMPPTAKLLRQANFTEVEIGLQSIDPMAMQLMDRNNNLHSYQRAARAMLDNGIRVKVDLIIGLPGDTVDSIRRSLDYIHDSGLYTSVQVFNLAILPGTAFRHEASQLGLRHQARPPYYVLETPTLDLATMVDLMDEAQDLFDAEFDPLAEPAPTRAALDWSAEAPIPATRPEDLGLIGEIVCGIGQNGSERPFAGENMPHEGILSLNPADLAAGKLHNHVDRLAQAVNVRLTGGNLGELLPSASAAIRQLLLANPHTTLQITLPDADLASVPQPWLDTLHDAAHSQLSYLDHYYAVLPGPVKGAKRLVGGGVLECEM
ncbi:MAG: radical SAM protein [Pirellulales bacterium]|nr:radical SAM protein [Pirellulales bacterium]